MTEVDSLFDRDKFLLRQKIRITAQYDVCDEEGNSILFVERPTYLMRTLLAILAGFGVALLFTVILILLIMMTPEAAQPVIAVIGGLLLFVAILAAMFAVMKKRHVTIYRDPSKQEPLLKILQDSKFLFPVATYTVRDMDGEIAKLRKNYLYNLIRKRWNCYHPDGRLLCVAQEDSIWLSLLRRFLEPLMWVVRTNFIIFQGDSDRQIGEFNRKFTLLDRYVLDMSADSNQQIDRRIALALGVMLDTGEGR